ncbi:MAG TPA: hypothetical protein VE961_07240 [Pyrinomonadaceae bacterium]|nr:hypothetical protein [Pyrinomonadaceae bacterium]
MSLVLPIIPLVVFLGCLAAYGQGATKVEKRVESVPATEVQPLAGFSFSSTTESRLKLAAAPVEISIGDGMFMSSVKVENAAQKEVQSLKLVWYLFDDETSTKEVKKGETKSIKLTLPPGESKMIDSKIPSFDNLFKSVAHDGYIGGKWFLEVVVAEVEYRDGTKWTR